MKKHSRSGFTLVELLIAVTVMAILASVIAIAYDGIHERARNTKRLNDIIAIKDALETYRASTGTYPTSPSGPYGGWDTSADTDGFMTSLKDSGYMKEVPVDPLNSGPTGSDLKTGYRYQYNNFSDMSYLAGKGCATDRGNLAVLMIVQLESTTTTSPDSPGFTCTSRNFNAEGAWVWGDYDKAA